MCEAYCEKARGSPYRDLELFIVQGNFGGQNWSEHNTRVTPGPSLDDMVM